MSSWGTSWGNSWGSSWGQVQEQIDFHKFITSTDLTSILSQEELTSILSSDLTKLLKDEENVLSFNSELVDLVGNTENQLTKLQTLNINNKFKASSSQTSISTSITNKI